MTTETVCDKCGVEIGAPHQWRDDDCILDHADHSERFVGLICRRHYHWIDSSLEQILELFALLPGALLPAANGLGGSRASGDVDAPAPGRVDVMALFDERSHRHYRDEHGDPNSPEYPHIFTSLGGWVQILIEERGLTELPDFLPLTGIIGLLRGHRQWIAQQPWIDDYTIEINDIHVALARGVRDSMWPASIGKCPNCSSKLYNTIGVDEVVCRKCKSAWAGVHLARLRLVLEQEAG